MLAITEIRRRKLQFGLVTGVVTLIAYLVIMVTGLGLGLNQFAGTGLLALNGDYLAYTVVESYWSSEGSVMLHHLPSGEETLLVGPEAAVGAAALDGSLAAYNTNRYQGEQLMFPSDIELYDIETGERRRVTAEPSNLRAFYLSFPYLLLIDWLLVDLLANDYYVAHLVRLGIADEAGHLLPGEGVILPPR